MRRLLHKDYAKPFYDSLLAIQLEAIVINRPFPDQPSITTSMGKRDAAFLESLSQPINETFLHLSELDIPNLRMMAAGYKSGSELPSIYTAKTCIEVHRLLSIREEEEKKGGTLFLTTAPTLNQVECFIHLMGDNTL